MQRIGKKSFTKAKSKLLCFLLSGALLFGNLMAFQTVPASAAERMEQDNGNQEMPQGEPSEPCGQSRGPFIH